MRGFCFGGFYADFGLHFIHIRKGKEFVFGVSDWGFSFLFR